MTTENMKFLQTILNLFIGVTGLISITYLTISGIQYITENGDNDSIQKARKSIIIALFGLIICFGFVLVISFITATLTL